MAQRRRSPKENEIINAAVEDMLRCGVIQPSQSSWAAEPHLIKKDSGEYHFCVDFHPLNKVTIHDVFLIPRIDDILDQLGGSSYFTLLD